VRPHGDEGLTLVELLLATSITAMLGSVIAGAFFVGFKTTDTANQRLAGSQGAQLITSYFPADVGSSSATATVLAISRGATPCTGADRTVAVLSWPDTDATGASVAKQATYTCVVSGTRLDLVRRYSEAGGTPREAVLAYDVTGASLTCSPNPDCSAPRTATITATEVGGFTFSVTGRRRVS